MKLNLKERLQSLKMVAGGWQPQSASLSDSPPQADDQGPNAPTGTTTTPSSRR